MSQRQIRQWRQPKGTFCVRVHTSAMEFVHWSPPGQQERKNLVFGVMAAVPRN